ncbi:MAG: ABC transporter substrate-binding protein [Acetobacteraceae bacterium]|nr:ABC transporter substrate-binding protein [Acetobacteraceae bacterium]
MTLHRRAVLGGAMAFPAAMRRAWAEAEPLALGALYPLSGMLALFGDESYRGLELAVDEQNAAGGVLERPIKLVKGDAVDAAAAASEVKRLIGAERVGAVFGSFASPLVIAASQATELAGLPYFELGAICDPVLDRGFRYLWRSCSSATMLAALSVDTVAETLARAWGMAADPHRANLRVAILHEDGMYGSTVSALQKARCQERGLTVIDTLAYSAAAPDLGAAVQRLRGADVTVVLHTGYQSDTVMFYRQMNQAGWMPRMVVGAGGGYAMVDTATAIGPDFDGTLNVGFPPYAVNPDVAPGLRPVEAAYERKYGTKPRSGHSLANYVGAKLFLGALTRAGSLDKDKVRSAVLASAIALNETANSWGVRFDDKGQNTLALPVVAQWGGNVLRTVLPREAAVAVVQPQLGR